MLVVGEGDGDGVDPVVRSQLSRLYYHHNAFKLLFSDPMPAKTLRLKPNPLSHGAPSAAAAAVVVVTPFATLARPPSRALRPYPSSKREIHIYICTRAKLNVYIRVYTVTYISARARVINNSTVRAPFESSGAFSARHEVGRDATVGGGSAQQ